MNNILGLNDKVELYKLNLTDFSNSANQVLTNQKLDTLNSKDFSTSVKQDISNNSLSSIDTKSTTINNSITSTNSKLDTLNSKDFSTSAKQDISNNSLSSIDTKFTTLNNTVSTSALQNTTNNYLNNMNYILSNSFSTLGRIYTQTAYEVFQSKFDTNTNLDFYDYSFTNTGVSVNPNTSTLELVATGSQTKQFQTKYKAYYEAGKSTELYFTAQLYDTVNPNSSTYFGLFNAQNGLIIGYDGTTNDIRIIRRTNTSGVVVNNIIPRTSFNLNTLNGFDFTKFQLFHCHILWFGYAYFHFSLVHNGQLIKFHEEFFTNNSTVPYLKTPSLPFSIENITTSGNQNCRMTCMSTNIENGYDLIQKSFNINNGLVLKTVTTTETPLCIIRINPTFNLGTIRIKTVEIVNTTTTNNQTVQFAGYILHADSATITPVGGVFTSSTNSIAQYNVTATGMTYAGIKKQIYNNYMISNVRTNDIVNPLDNEINFTINNGSDYFYLVAQTSNGNVTVNFNVIIEEIY